MLRKFLAAALACAVFGTASLAAYADAPKTSSANSAESETQFIYSEISEKSLSGYSLYEEILANQIVFYSNVANGDIADHSVTLDLPETVEVEAEKDGKKIEYTSGKAFEETGKYALTLKVKGSDLLGGNENEVYYGMFRFWIVEPAEEEQDNYNDYDDYDDYDGEDYPEEPSDNSDDNNSENVGDSEINPSDNVSDSEVENTSESAEAESEDKGTLLPPTDKASGLSQYAQNEEIRVVTEKGTEFFCNIPAGFTTVNSVRLELPEKAICQMLKDGEEIADFDFSSNITEIGEYTLLITDGDSANPSEFSFTIIGSYVKELTNYSVPKGCRIENAMLNNAEIRANETSVDLGEEGEYNFDIFCGDIYFVESFTLDNTPPEFTVNGLDAEGKAYGGVVTLELVSEDIDTYSITLNGEPCRRSLELSDTGVYTVSVFDKAGNVSTQSFEIVYRMDGMAILTIVLAGALVVAGVVFFIITRKKFIIR